MRPITYLVGDATEPQVSGVRIIAHVCNDVGAWGAGFVMALSRKWPEPELLYREWHASGKDFALGAMQLVTVNAKQGEITMVANMVAQCNTDRTKGPPIRYDALSRCLYHVACACRDIKIPTSVHMPRIGCGIAGGTWDKVEPIIQEQLSNRDIPVYVYDMPSTFNIPKVV